MRLKFNCYVKFKTIHSWKPSAITSCRPWKISVADVDGRLCTVLLMVRRGQPSEYGGWERYKLLMFFECFSSSCDSEDVGTKITLALKHYIYTHMLYSVYTHELLVFGSGSLKSTDYAVGQIQVEVRVLIDAKVATSRLNLTEWGRFPHGYSMSDIPCWPICSFHSESSECCRSWQPKRNKEFIAALFFSPHEIYIIIPSCFDKQWIISMPVVPCEKPARRSRRLCCLLPAALGRGSRWYAANATRRVDCLTSGGFEGTCGGILGRLEKVVEEDEGKKVRNTRKQRCMSQWVELCTMMCN